MRDSGNPLTRGHFIGANYSSDLYHKQTVARGTHDFVMSRSELCEFNHCPSRWRTGFRSGGSDATEWGSLVDCLALVPSEFAKRYAVTPVTYPAPAHHEKVKKGTIAEGSPLPWNANAGYCGDWEAKNEGKEIISAKDEFQAQTAIERLYRDGDIATVLRNSQKQVYVTALYTDKATGISVGVKALVDIVPDVKSKDYGKSLVDLKTSRDARPSKWARWVHEHDYHIQAAMHLDIYNAATQEDRVEFCHIVQENFPPYQTCLNLLSTEFVQLGRDKYLTMLKRYCKCIEENHWGGYEETAQHNGVRVLNGWVVADPEGYMVNS